MIRLTLTTCLSLLLASQCFAQPEHVRLQQHKQLKGRFGGAVATPSDPGGSLWNQRQPITVQSTQVDSDLTNFPVRITRTQLADNVVDPSNVNASQTDGGDVRFSLNADGTNPLACDVITWEHDSATGADDAYIEAYVEVPTVSSSTNTVIYVHWAHDSSETQPAIDATYGKHATYPDSLVRFYPEGGGFDRTSNAGHTTDNEHSDETITTSVLSGIKCRDYENIVGGGAVEYGNTGLLPDSSHKTFTALVYLDALPTIVSYFGASFDTDKRFYMGVGTQANGNPFAVNWGNTGDSINGTALSTGQWYHMALRESGGTISGLLNGAVDVTAGSATFSGSATSNVFLGSRGYNNAINGKIGPTAIYTASMSDAWIKADSVQTLTPGTFAVAGAAELSGGVSLPAGDAPDNLIAPVANSTSQSLTVGHTLTADPKTWTNGTSSVQWVRADDGSGTNAANISGATSTTYVLQSADKNKYIAADVTQTNTNGTTTVRTAYVGPISDVSAEFNGDGDLVVTLPSSETITDATGWTVTPDEGADISLAYSSGSGTAEFIFTCTPKAGGSLTSTMIDYDSGTGNVSNLTDVNSLVVATNNSPIPTAPYEYEPPAFALPAGTVHNVATEAELTTAINDSVRGDVIVIDNTVTLSGSWNLPDKGAGTDWIYLISKAEYDTPGTLTAPGTRIGDSDVTNMAKLETSSFNRAALSTQFGASYYRLVGIQFLPLPASDTTSIVLTGKNWSGSYVDPVTESQLPHDIVFDRCMVRGRGKAVAQVTDAGMQLNGNNMAVVDSVIDKIEADTENQGIIIWMGGSGYLIENTKIQATTENLLVGGAGPAFDGVNPRDIVVRKGWIEKPTEWNEDGVNWDGEARQSKNILELKTGNRVLIEGCVLEGSWFDGQAGEAFVVTVRNQSSSAPWSEVRDVMIRDTIVKRCVSGVRINNGDDGKPSRPMLRVTFDNILMHDLTLDVGGGSRRIFRFAANQNQTDYVGKYVRILRCTADGGIGQSMWFEGTGNAWEHTTIQNSILKCGGSHSIVATSEGTAGMNEAHANDNWALSNLLMFGGSIDRNSMFTSPATNVWANDEDTEASVEFTDTGNPPSGYALQATSPYAAGNARDATDGTDLGADIGAITTATSGVDQ